MRSSTGSWAPAFTWPAWAPVVELDHVLSRGLRPAATRVLPVTGSDHRPLMVDFRSVLPP